MGTHDVLGDGEAEAGPAGFAGTGFVDAVETFEKARKVLGGNAGAEVADIKFDATLRGAGAELDASAGAAVLHRVIDQVGENLVNGFAVCEDEWEGLDGSAGTVAVFDMVECGG